MKTMVKIGGKLAIICAVAAAVLGLMNAVTEPRIEQIQQERLEAALEKVSEGMIVGEAQKTEEDATVTTYYPLYEGSKDDSPEGYICRMLGNGYGGEMAILAGYTEEGEIFAVQMMENSETPGLGKEAEKAEYMQKYIGTGTEKPVPVRKDMLSQEEADAVTGATITFIGVAKALVEGSDFVDKLEGN
jgi:electron transport complex protein RnfG